VRCALCYGLAPAIGKPGEIPFAPIKVALASTFESPTNVLDTASRSSSKERPMPHAQNSIFNPELFKPEAISDETRAFNKGIIAQFSHWWEVGAQTVRDARARGEGPFTTVPKSDKRRRLKSFRT
jgi:hypothetical protein